MYLNGIKLPKNRDERDIFLAAYAVARANQRARAKGLPLYYVKDGYLVEERRGKFKKLARITRNELFD